LEKLLHQLIEKYAQQNGRVSERDNLDPPSWSPGL
jgi:hypothetical protein